MDKELEKLYYNPKSGFTSSTKLYKKAKESNINVSQKDINDFLNNQAIYQIFKQPKKPTLFSTIVSNGIRDEYQMDIMVYDRYEFHKYKYILIIIDIYSRYVEARAMTNRENTTINKNVEDMLSVMGKPRLISCDNEFNTKEFNKYCMKNDISVRYSEPNEIQKNSIVERFNRTIAGYLNKIRISLKKYDWAKYLDDVIYNYNHSYHRTIKNTPDNIFNKNGNNNQEVVFIPRKFKIGDKVRIKLRKKIFDKGDIFYYSKETYLIVDIKINMNIKKYLLSNDKYYQGKDLMKVENIIYYNPENDNEEEKQFNENRELILKNKKLKRIDVDENNILNSRRTPKPSLRFV